MTDPRMTTTVSGGLTGALVTAFVPTLPALLPASAAQAAPVLLSQGGPATASSRENAGTAAAGAVDGGLGTRWSSTFSDRQWLQVDLGAPAAIERVELRVNPGVGFPNPLAASVGGNGPYGHVVNGIGAPTSGTSTIPSTVVFFP